MVAPPDSSVEVLTLLDGSNVVNYLVGIKSLLLYSPRPLAVTVLSDGTLTESDRSVLSSHVIGIRILDALPEATKAICAALGTDERKNHIYIRKLVDLPLQSRAPYVLFFDSDIVFRRPIPLSFFDLNGKGVLYNKDHDHSRYDKSFHHVLEYVATLGKATPVTNLNSGLMLWDRSLLLSSDILDYPRFVKQKTGLLYYLIEQDSFCALASKVPAAPMPIEYLVLCNWDDTNPQTRKNAISIHYVGGERYKNFDYRNDGLAVLRQLPAKN
jgi:hypothetical protein